MKQAIQNVIQAKNKALLGFSSEKLVLLFMAIDQLEKEWKKGLDAVQKLLDMPSVCVKDDEILENNCRRHIVRQLFE